MRHEASGRKRTTHTHAHQVHESTKISFPAPSPLPGHSRWPLLAARSPFVSRDRAASSPAPTASGELGMAILLRGTSAAAAATAGPSSTLLATTFRRARGCGRLLPAAPRLRRAFAARASAQPLEVCAKESITVPGRLGDCELSLNIYLCVHARGSLL